MDPMKLAIRASLDLRGVRPSAEEMEAVEADPAALDGLIDAWMEDPRFEERVAELYQEVFLTRNDSYLISAASYGLGDEAAFSAAIGGEVPRMVGRIAAEDLPWTELVTGDWTMANEVLAQIWPLDYPAGGTGWQAARYTDGRPAAGVLATNGLWWRYYSTLSNYNRGRAAAVSRLLLCEDYLARPVSFDNSVALVDAAGIEGALRANPYCMGCHSSLDPLAATFFGFWVANEYNAQEMDHYHAEREPLAGYLLGQEPALAGQPLQGLAHLGQQIAADPRFPRCAAESFAEALWRREVAADDFDRMLSTAGVPLTAVSIWKVISRSTSSAARPGASV